MGTAGRVEPHVAAAGEQAGHFEVVVLHKEDLAEEAGIARPADHFFNELYALAVRRMGLAGHDEHRGTVRVVEQTGEAVGIGKEHGGALVGREAAGEADDERVLREAGEPLHALVAGDVGIGGAVGQAFAQGVDERLLLGAAGGPEFIVGNGLHLVPGGIFGMHVEPVGAEVVPQQNAEGGAHIGGGVHAVGHMADGQFRFGEALPDIAPHAAGNHAVHGAHTVGLRGHAQGEHRHVEVVGVAAVLTAESEEVGPFQTEHLGIGLEVAAHEIHGEAFVAGVHGGVRGEHAGAADEGLGFIEGEVVALHVLTQAFQHEEGGVAFVHVPHGRRDAEGGQHAHAADAQQDFLTHAHVAVGLIEAGGDAAVVVAVLGHVGIHEVQRHAAHLQLPDAGVEGAGTEGQGDHERVALVVEHGFKGQAGGLILGVLRVLMTALVHGLLKVAVQVEEAHADEGQAFVAGGLQVVAGKDAQTAGIKLQTFMQAVFGGEVGDGPFGRNDGGAVFQRVGDERLRHVGVEVFTDLLQTGHEGDVGGKVAQAVRRRAFHHGDGIVAAFLPQVGIHALEKRHRFGLPAPPDVVGEVAQAAQFGGKFRHGVQRAQEGNGRRTHGEFLGDGGCFVAGGETAGMGLFIGQVVRLSVELEELIPGGMGCGGAHGAAPLIEFFVGAGSAVDDDFGERVHGLGVIGVAAGDDAYAGLNADFVFHLADPEAEAGKIGGDGGHAVGGAFMGSIAPGLVPGGEHTEVAAGKHVEIRHVEEAVVPVEQGGNKHDLHVVVLRIVQAEAAAGGENGIIGRVVDLMAGEEARFRHGRIGHHGRIAVYGLFVHAGMTAHHEHEREHLVGGVLHGLLGLGESVEEEIHALVVIFVAAGNDENAGVGGDFAAQQTAHGSKELPAVFQSALAVGAVVVDDGEVEPVVGDDVGRAAEEDAGFFGGDAAHRGEHVGFTGAHGFHGALGRDVVAIGFLRGGDFRHAGVDVHAVAGHGAAEHRGVGGEHRAHGRSELLERENARAAHPFMEVGHAVALVAGGKHLMNGGDDFAAGIAEQHRFDIVPAAGKRIDAEAFPELAQYLIRVVAAVEVHEDDARTAGDFPAAEAAAQILVLQGVTQSVPAGFVRLGELRIFFGIGSDEEVLAVVGVHRLLRLACDDLIDAADFVAHFPADLEKVGA